MAGEALAIVGIKQLVTLKGPARPRIGAEMRELSIIENGALIVEDGTVTAAGTEAEIKPLIPQSAETIDAGGRLVTPGLVDAHTHLLFAGNRADEFARRASGASYQQIANEGGGILSTVAKTRGATEDELVASGKRHAEWMLRCGTTTAEAKSGYGLSVEDEMKMLRAIKRVGEETPLSVVPTVLAAHACPAEMKVDQWVQIVESELLPRVKSENLAEFCDVFCESGYFDVNASRRILTKAKELGFGLRIHADQLSNSGGAKLAAELRAKTADHLEHTDSSGILALMRGAVQPVLLPGSVYALGHNKYPAAREIIDVGFTVVLASDFNPGSSPTPSLPMVMSIAFTQMRMTPEEAICACTVNAAHSLNRRNRGTLETGKRADLVIWNCEDYREIPYWFGVEMAWKVFVGGKCVVSR